MASNSKKVGSFEKELFEAANALRKNVDAAEYKHFVLGLVFLKYVSDLFDDVHKEIEEDPYSDPEDRDEYMARHAFWIPPNARWEGSIRPQAKSASIGAILDDAMIAIERENQNLKDILPKGYSNDQVAAETFGELINLITNKMDIKGEAKKSKDLFGRVYEYFLGQFALDEGRKGGQFYTPRSIVELLVEMIEPHKGRIYDPCCGSGGMFVMSEKFIEKHRGRSTDIAIYGQESNRTTYRLCRMNLAVRSIDGSLVEWNNEGSFQKDAHPQLKADFILANPPFNDRNWGADLLEGDARWKYGAPPAGNANFAWVQHFIHHLSPTGIAGFVLSKGSLTSKSSNEDEIRKSIIRAGIVDCIVNLPAKLFLNTQIPACLWFISNKRHGRNGDRKRSGEILFMDASELGHLINRRTKEFSDADINKVAGTYHEWRRKGGKYEDVPGFCKSESIERVKELGYILSPGRYVGIAEEDDDFDFETQFKALQVEFEEQVKEEAKLNKRIKANLAKVRLRGGNE